MLGAGADDLILLVARAFAGPGDAVAIPAAPTYPLFRLAAELAGATVGDENPVLTYCCRPGNPLGDLPALPAARPLVVDEAYFEYAGETARAADRRRRRRDPHVLEGVRRSPARASATRSRERTPRRSCAPPGARAGLDAFRGARGRRARNPARCQRGRRGARAARGGTAALGFEPLPSRANFVFVRVGRRGARRAPARAAAASSASRAAASGSPSATARTTTSSSPRSRVRRQSRRGASRHVRATAETTVRMRLGLDGAGRVRVGTGAGLYDHLLEQLAFHGGLDLWSTAAATGRPGRITRRRTPRSRSARRSTARSATARDRALRLRRRADGRRARARRRRPRRPARCRDRARAGSGARAARVGASRTRRA